jgi:hypothetical protein
MNTSDIDTTSAATSPANVPSDTKLVRALQYANEWLRYGEAKHAALITLNGATLTALNNLAKPGDATSGTMTAWFWVAVTCCAVSILASLSSFYARTDPNRVLNLTSKMTPAAGELAASRSGRMRTMAMKGPNLVFFGHLAQMSPDKILKALVGDYDAKADMHYLEHMAEQVVINSRLALIKAKLFNAALLVYLLPVIMGIAFAASLNRQLIDVVDIICIRMR